MNIQFNAQSFGNPKNPGLVFLHGFLGSSQDWTHIAQRLSDTFYCICIDLPGHGATRHHTNFSIETVGHELIHFLKRYKKKHWAIVGYSLGGRLTLYLHTQFHEISRSVIFSAHPGLQSEQEKINRRYNDELWAKQIDTDFVDFIERWYEQPIFASLKNHKSFSQITHQRTNEQSAAGLALSLRCMGLGEQPSLWNDLQKNNRPFLYICGELDQKFKSIGQQIAEQCSVATVLTIEKVGHAVFIEQEYRDTVRLIRDFLTKG